MTVNNGEMKKFPCANTGHEILDSRPLWKPGAAANKYTAVSCANEAAQGGPKNRRTLFAIIAAVVIVAVVVLLLVFFKGGDTTSENTEGLLAKVGDSEITQAMVDGEAPLLLYLDYGISPDQLSEAEYEVFKNQVLVYLFVQTEMVKEHLKAAGIMPSEEQLASVATQIDSLYESTPDAEATFAAMGVTRADVEYLLSRTEYMLAYQAEIGEKDPVTDEDIKSFYDENVDAFAMPMQISASHILIMDADHTPEKRAEMQAILDRALAGEDFAELAKEFSEDGSAQAGGDVGYFGENNSFVPEFSAAALALENVGDISDIVETQFGYHIIKLTDRQEASTQPLDAVSADIGAYLLELKTAEAINALKEEIAVKYFCEVDPATGEPYLTMRPQDVAELPQGSADTPESTGAAG